MLSRLPAPKPPACRDELDRWTRHLECGPLQVFGDWIARLAAERRDAPRCQVIRFLAERAGAVNFQQVARAFALSGLFSGSRPSQIASPPGQPVKPESVPLLIVITS